VIFQSEPCKVKWGEDLVQFVHQQTTRRTWSWCAWTNFQ